MEILMSHVRALGVRSHLAAIAASAAAFALVLASPMALAAAGNADPLFADNGLLRYEPNGFIHFVNSGERSVFLNPIDGSFAAVFEEGPAGTLVKWNAYGHLDTAFGDNGRKAVPLSGFPLSHAFDRQGRIVMMDGQHVVRLKTDGSLDETFGRQTIPVFEGQTALAVSLQVQPDERVVLLLKAPAPGGRIHVFTLYRLLPDGTPDAAFNARARTALTSDATVTEEPTSFALLPGGGFLVAGTALLNRTYVLQCDYISLNGCISVPGPFEPSVARVLAPDGTVDARFGADGRTAFPGTSGLTVKGPVAGGRVYMRHQWVPPGHQQPALYFSEVQGFTPTSMGAQFYYFSRDPQGRFYSGWNAFAMVRYDLQDRFDTSYGNQGEAGARFPGYFFGAPPQVLIGEDGKALAVTTAVDPQGKRVFMAQRFQADEVRGTVVEYYQSDLDHYFMTSSSDEQAYLDAGGDGPNWSRTGFSFQSGGPSRVCRFYSALHDSHFFSVEPFECALVRNDPEWTFEGYDFSAWPPLANGTCRDSQTPVYRAYNNRDVVGSNHRYLTSLNEYARQAAKGWLAEGVAMCLP
jgi:hypothetical protein